MKPDPPQEPTWTWPYPQTWRQVFTVIIGLDIAFLALAFLLDWLKRVFAT